MALPIEFYQVQLSGTSYTINFSIHISVMVEIRFKNHNHFLQNISHEANQQSTRSQMCLFQKVTSVCSIRLCVIWQLCLITHMKVRKQPKWCWFSPSLLFEIGLLCCFPAVWRQANRPSIFRHSSVSAPHLAIGSLELQICVPVHSFMWVLRESNSGCTTCMARALHDILLISENYLCLFVDPFLTTIKDHITQTG